MSEIYGTSQSYRMYIEVSKQNKSRPRHNTIEAAKEAAASFSFFLPAKSSSPPQNCLTYHVVVGKYVMGISSYAYYDSGSSSTEEDDTFQDNGRKCWTTPKTISWLHSSFA